MLQSSKNTSTGLSLRKLYGMLKPYREKRYAKVFQQILLTVAPFLMIISLMFYGVTAGWNFGWLLLLAMPAALFHVRVFILFHDCCHGSLFKSRRANQIWGTIFGAITFTPYEMWRESHLAHHATAGNLNQRGHGDIWTMTVAEYREAGKWKRFLYRLYRNPLVMFVLGPVYIFWIRYRFPEKNASVKQVKSVMMTNILLLGAVLALGSVFGVAALLKVFLPISLLSGIIGVWLFYVQHQYPETYWAGQEEWSPLDAALKGSSFYQLPRVMAWLTGYIGYHHIHHADERIPHYALSKCHVQVDVFKSVKPITVRESLGTILLKLWHEEQQRLISFRQFKKMASR